MDGNWLANLRECCRDEAAFQQMQQILAEQTEQQVIQQAEQQRALFHVITKIRETLDLDTIFKTTATEVRQLLNADRVGIFRFYHGSGYTDGEFVSEDTLPEYRSALSTHIHDDCFGENFSLHYLHGRVQATEDIHIASLKDCHKKILAQFQVRANLVVPLLREQELWGLLCIHQCSKPRRWSAIEIDFVKQIAIQLSVALQQAELLKQTQQQSQVLTQALQNLQQAQTQLIQHEKMSSLGQLVAGIAHEINNPVNFIYGNLNHVSQYANNLLELLGLYQQELPQPSEELRDRLLELDFDFIQTDFPKLLQSMQIGADRIRQIILSLRNFSRLDESEMKPVNIHEGIESTLLILQYRLKSKTGANQIQVIKEYGSLPLVECYPSQLNQVFMNILCNAIDAFEGETATVQRAVWDLPQTEEESDRCRLNQITIRTELFSENQQGTPQAVIRIRDNGPGIPESIQAKLFDPFFTTKPAGRGTGLGLSISYRIIVERHHGSLQCNSQLDRGTEFRIQIPIHQIG